MAVITKRKPETRVGRENNRVEQKTKQSSGRQRENTIQGARNNAGVLVEKDLSVFKQEINFN